MINIFISFAKADEDLKNKLNSHLTVLNRNGIAFIWHQKELTAGCKFEEGIKNLISNADIVLLLVSSDYLASDYCYNKEMLFSMSRHEQQKTIVVPIILRPCVWDETPFGYLTVLSKNGKAITEHSNRDKALCGIVNHIKKIIQLL